LKKKGRKRRVEKKEISLVETLQNIDPSTLGKHCVQLSKEENHVNKI